MAIQPDGKIIIGGHFVAVNGVPRPKLARLNADGSVDTGFVGGAALDDEVYAIDVDPSGEILIGGEFTTYDGPTLPTVGFARLSSNGMLAPQAGIPSISVAITYALERDASGRVLMAGGLFPPSGQTEVIRLNSDVTYDSSFFSPYGNDSVEAIAVQNDGHFSLTGPCL